LKGKYTAGVFNIVSETEFYSRLHSGEGNKIKEDGMGRICVKKGRGGKLM
jgi:hypothetical protein